MSDFDSKLTHVYEIIVIFCDSVFVITDFCDICDNCFCDNW